MKTLIERHTEIDQKINEALLEGARKGLKMDTILLDKVMRQFLHVVEDAHTENVEVDDFTDAVLSLMANIAGELIARTVERHLPRMAEEKAQLMINQLAVYIMENLQANYSPKRLPSFIRIN